MRIRRRATNITLFILLFFVNLSYGANIEVLSEFSEETLPVHTENIRKLNEEIDDRKFHNRGDPSAWDYSETGDKSVINTNGSWHDLDLSSIVPKGAKAVFLTVYIIDDAMDSYVAFRKNGNLNTYSQSQMFTQVADQRIQKDVIVACDSNSVIEYKAANLAFTGIYIVIKGWWK